MKILHICDAMELGGAETHIVSLSEELTKMKHDIFIASEYGPMVEKLIYKKLNFFEINFSDSLFKVSIEILEYIENENIDLIHVHPSKSQIIGYLINLIKKIPVVSTIHGAYYTPILQVKKYLEACIFVSEESFNHYKKIKAEPFANIVEVIPNSILFDNSKIVNKYNQKLKITYISRVSEDKLQSIIFFLKSIEQIAKKVDVEIIGTGNSLNIVEGIINNNPKLSEVKVIPGTIEPEKYIENSNVIVGVGRVILEGISLGKVTICIGNQNYVGIVNEKNFKKISKVNFTDRNTNNPLSTQLFLDDIVSLIDKNKEYLNINKNLINLASENHSIENSAKKHINIYQKSIENNKKNLVNEPYKIEKISENVPGFNDINQAIDLLNNGYIHFIEKYKEKILIFKPDIKFEKWKNDLNRILANDKFENFSIVIIICKEHQSEIEIIVNEIEDIIIKYENHFEFDIILDFKHNSLMKEVLLLSTADYLFETKPDYLSFISKIIGIEILKEI